MAVVFSVAVTVVIAGFLWFYIVRPILEDYGIMAPRAVSYYQADEPSPVRVMSRSPAIDLPSAASVLETDAGRTPDGRTLSKPKAEEYLTLCKLMRAAGINRDDALSAFKACGIPFNSNVWRDAAPPPPADDYRTPIVGRPTRAVFETDPELAYEPPE